MNTNDITKKLFNYAIENYTTWGKNVLETWKEKDYYVLAEQSHGDICAALLLMKKKVFSYYANVQV